MISTLSEDDKISSDFERVEDEELLTGSVEYVDDIDDPWALHAVIVRSQYGHAKIENINTSKALALDGVIDVITMSDMEEAKSPTPNRLPIYCPPDIEIPETIHRPVLAGDRVRYQGEPIAVVLAEERYLAADAVEKVTVEYDSLDAVSESADALAEDAPTLYDEVPDNLVFDWELGPEDAVDGAFAEADHVVSAEINESRVNATPLEPRGALVDYDPGTGRITATLSTQTPNVDRGYLAEVLEHPEHKIHVKVPRIGGGFGPKARHYPDEAAIVWCARELKRSIKWQSTRIEASMSDTHGRSLPVTAELAFNDDGSFAGIRADGIAELGAHVSDFALPIKTYVFAPMLCGQYEIPIFHCHIRGVLTNAPPMDAYRGVSQVGATNLIERLVDLAASKLDVDPAELRRQNMVSADEFPYEAATQLIYDSGDFEGALDKALEIADYESLRERQAELRKEGRYLGIGLSSFLQVTGFGPSFICAMAGVPGHHETARVNVHKSGEVSVYCGTQDFGMSHRSTYAKIVGDQLGIPYEDVDVIEGDTEQISEGVGTHASRSVVVGGGAISKSVEKIVDKASEVAAHQLEASEDDIEFEDGEFSVAGAPERSMTIQEVALQANLGLDVPGEPGLEKVSYYEPETMPTTYGTHIAIVEVDPETGTVEFDDYVAVNDCGEQIKPKIVEGQVHGGVAQAIGQALYESIEFDDNGNLLTGSMQDYTMPKAEHIPNMQTDSLVSPAPLTQLGAKGIGETGPIAGVAAVVNAVSDALEPFGFDGTEIDLPLTEQKIWEITTDGVEIE